jgi:proline iminopeptidase
MDPAALAEIKKLEAAGDTENPRYMELLIPNHYEKHLLRMPAAEWPDPLQRAFKHVNNKVYVPMQGPSELGASGKLANWDRMADLPKITVPTLMIGAKYDTMDPELMKKMAGLVKHGRFLYCPNGSHLCLYDDQKIYFEGLIRFIKDVDKGKF